MTLLGIGKLQEKFRCCENQVGKKLKPGDCCRGLK